MTNTGGPRAWQYLKRNPDYVESWRQSAIPAPDEPAPFPLRVQSEADRKAAAWGMLAWEDPTTEDGPASPFWADAPTLEEAEGQLNVVTIEDPVEYPIPGAVQIAVPTTGSGEERGKHFRNALMHFCRVHPASGMVSEIRDADAARQVLQFIGLCCKLGEGAMRDQGASCSPYDSALARRSCSHAMASVRAHGPRPKARSTIRASPTMPPWRANIPAWPLRSARITSKPLIVA